jgi:DNA-binding CsgD family transcriptional regulator
VAKNIHDRSLGRTRSGGACADATGATGCLARFVFDERRFKLVLCRKKHPPEAVEVARFRLGGETVAVLEDRDPAKSTAAAREIIGKLTERELQIAAMVAQGAATKNIAYELRISEWTVVTHLRRIFAKLNVDNRAAMVYRCAPLIKGAAFANSAYGAPRAARYPGPEEIGTPHFANNEHEQEVVKV